ncbi:hypothetical protein B0H14DRAFT_3764552 [Mycena olivaceomarginata]|nr:hypothetical protein B0H14DRAFT_3764552 [Mycena olivaceomarginata]
MAAVASHDDTIELRGSSDDDLPTVNEMIQGVIDDQPKVAAQFIVNTPAIMEKEVSSKPRKQGHTDTAAKRKHDSDQSDEKATKAKSKRNRLDSDADEPPPSITYYIYIAKPVVATSKKKAATDDDLLQKGPFSLLISHSYSSLLTSIAAELPCHPENLNKSKLKPKNAEKLPLTSDKGYKAMVTEMKEKTVNNRVVLLYMPAPMKPMEEEMPWDTNEEPMPAFDYSKLEPAGASSAIQEQKVSFIQQTTKEERERLENRYPIGQYPQFADKRVYFDSKTGFYFELNSSRCLGSSVGSGGAVDVNETKPPNSNFFDANQRIKNIPAIPAPVPAPVPTPVPAPAATPAGSIPALGGASFSEILLATLLSSGGLGALLNPGALHGPTARSTPLSNPPANPRSTPPSPIKRHKVTVDQFCDIYGLEDDDAVLLKEVRFRPGDQTTPTVDEELKSMGFTVFSWRRIHNANMKFKADLAAGMHD